MEPDSLGIAAVVEGYRQHRTLTATERDTLLEAIRFGPAFRGAIHCASAAQQGWSARFERHLTREYKRYMAGEGLTNTGSDESAPRVSPDGSRVAFFSNRDGNTEVYTMGIDGSGQRQLTHNTVDDGYAVWSQ